MVNSAPVMAKKSGHGDPDAVSFPLDRTRNIGIIAHIDAGKTTTTERILFYTGRQHRLGNVDEGNTTTDWLPQERERGITIIAAAVTTHWTPRQSGDANKHRINIIDTPGHVDFTAEVERSLRVLDGAIVVVSGVEGVQAQTETVWKQANRHRVPRILFVNKLDRIGADFQAVLQDLDKSLDAKALQLQIPIGQEKTLRGVVDLIEMKALTWQDMEGDEPAPAPDVGEVPADLKDDAELARIQLLERIADFDEKIAEKYLGEQEISPAEIRAAVRRLCLDMKVTPVLCGAAQRCKGVQPLLDGVCDYLPAPIDLPPVKGKVPRSKRQVLGGGGKDDGSEEVPEDWADGERKPDAKAPFCALAFKTDSDKNTELTYLRIYSGTIDGSTQVLNVRKNKRERLSQIFLMHANKREQLEQASAGEIVAAVGLRFTRTGDTLSDPDHPIVLGAITFPEPVISMAVEPVSTADKDELAAAIDRFAKNDPTFSSRVDPETGQTIISGMGELHLEIIRDRILREWNVKAKVGKPRVAYRQTITRAAEGENRFIRAGTKPMYGHVKLKIEPWKGQGEDRVQVLMVVPEDQIPRAFHQPIVESIKTAAQGGFAWGYPLIDVRVWVTGGSTHPTDSTEGAFSAAATQAFREAGESAGIILLEPIMELEVETPAESVGNIIRDLNARHAEIHADEEIKTGIHQIRARVPLAAMVGYSTDVRSLSQGRATFSMEPAAYNEVPESRRPQLF
jgi:elongation factor G